MTILIIDDSVRKRRIIEKALKEQGISFITVYAVDIARQVLDMGEKIDGIVLDMQLPIYSDQKSKTKNGGYVFLNWLSAHSLEIPVLGNSLQEFKTDYQYFKGQMPGDYDPDIFQEFLTSIKDHS